jgi:hypothetical protein
LTSSEIKKLHHPQNGSDSKSIQRTQHYFDDDEKDVELHFKKIKTALKKINGARNLQLWVEKNPLMRLRPLEC